MVKSKLLEQMAQNVATALKGNSFLYTSPLIVIGDSTDPIANAKNIKLNQKVKLGLLIKKETGKYSISPMGTITPTTEKAAKAITANFTDGKKLTNKSQVYIDKTSHLKFGNAKMPNHVNIREHSNVTLEDGAILANATISGYSDLHFKYGTDIDYTTFRGVVTGKRTLDKNDKIVFKKDAVKTTITGGIDNYLINIALGDNNVFSACDLSNSIIENSDLVNCQSDDISETYNNKSAVKSTVISNTKGYNTAIGTNHQSQTQNKIYLENSNVNDLRIMVNHSTFMLMHAHVNDSTLLDDPKDNAEDTMPAIINHSSITGLITNAPFVIDDAEIKGQQNAPFVAKDTIDADDQKFQSFYGGVLPANRGKLVSIRKGRKLDVVNPKDKYGYDFLKAVNKADNITSISENKYKIKDDHDFCKNVLSLADWQAINNVIDKVGDLDKAKTKTQTATKTSEIEPEL